MKYYFKKNNKKLGFSLVEMLVAVGIFMTIMTIAVSALISIVGANKKAQAIKSTIDSVTFAVEDISRAMRSGTNYQCATDYNLSFGQDCPMGGVAVKFNADSGNGATTTYIFYDRKIPGNENMPILQKKVGVNDSDLISKDSGINITSMKFYVLGANNELLADVSKRTQPRVVITVSGTVSTKGVADTSFSLQTTVSQRVRR